MHTFQVQTETTVPWTMNVHEPELFHFAFGTSLKGESHTDTTVKVAPDILHKSLDLLPTPELLSGGRKTSSKCSRISAISRQSCDTISVKYVLRQVFVAALAFELIYICV